MEKIHEEGIIPHEKGILQRDGIYFHSPSQFAKDCLYCVYWGAEDVCNFPYRVHREYLNIFMLTRILEGSLHYEYRGATFTAHAGDIVFQDCKVPNHYWAKNRVHLQFIHFSGNSAQSYCDMLFDQHGAHFTNCPQAGICFDDILKELKKAAPNDHKLSALISEIFCHLATPLVSTVSPSVQKAQRYMEAQFAAPLTLHDICGYVSLSPYYFSRLFKKETQRSPHRYLLELRLKHARHLLSITSDSVEAISVACGFTSPSHFIRAFKKETEMTPTSFRKIFTSGDSTP